MRILHTADWHLGRAFYGVQLTDDQAHVLDQFVRLVGDAQAEAVVIAGDIFDRSVPPTEAVRLLDEVLTRIFIDYKIPVLVIAGNHDSPERLGFGNRLLAAQGMHLAGRIEHSLQPIVLPDRFGPVYFCPIPYAEVAVVRERLAAERVQNHNLAMAALVTHVTGQLPPGARKVGIAHAFMAGGEESESERPLSVGGTGAVDPIHFHDFSYVALGHLHRPQAAGRDSIRFAGSLLKYSFAEANHRKSVTLVEVDEKGQARWEEISLTPKREVRLVEGYLRDILKGPQNGASKEDYLMISLKDPGAILDIMGKLREVYPNVLHIEREHLTGEEQFCTGGKDLRKFGELKLFSSFFQECTGMEFPQEYQQVLQNKLGAFHQLSREGR
jgi:exonuclease SbcD